MSAMKTCFLIAECRFSSAKEMQIECIISSLLEYFAEMPLFFCKDNTFFGCLFKNGMTC